MNKITNKPKININNLMINNKYYKTWKQIVMLELIQLNYLKIY